MSEIKAFKLVSGEELAGELLSETDEYYELTKLRQLGLVQIPVAGSPEPQVVPQFVPWLLGNSEGKNIKLFKTAISAGPLELVGPLEKLFVEQTSGIDLSTSIKM